MKIAVTYEEGKVFQHFGRTEAFKIYTISEGNVADSQVIDTEGNGHGALAGYLKEKGVCTLICGGLGGGAKSALEQAGIEVYAGVSGDTDQAIKDFLAGKLNYNQEANCHHHEHGHGEGHNCHGGNGSCHGA